VVVRLAATQLVLVLPTPLLPALQTELVLPTLLLPALQTAKGRARARERRVLLEQLLALLVLPTVLVLT
jgi:hypothetical protein